MAFTFSQPSGIVQFRRFSRWSNRQRRRIAIMSAQRPLRGRTVLVTGASRGIGRGIAVGLGELGATVYATGRRRGGAQDALEETARLVRVAGGDCETFAVDHGSDEAVKDLFAELRQRYDRDGIKLDVLVNNAYAAVNFLIDSGGIPTWRKSLTEPKKASDDGHPGEVWDHVNKVGLRGNFICSAYAMRQFNAQGSGVVVNISSFGGILSLFDGVYGVGKSGVDRLTAELAREAPTGVTCFTFYPGIVKTESLSQVISRGTADGELSAWNTESPLFVGRTLGKVLGDSKLTKDLHGRIVITAEIARKVGAVDENGTRPLSLRSVRFVTLEALPFLVNSPLRYLIPDIYIPFLFVVAYAGIIKVW